MGFDEEVVLVSYGGLLVFGKELLGHCRTAILVSLIAGEYVLLWCQEFGLKE